MKKMIKVYQLIFISLIVVIPAAKASAIEIDSLAKEYFSGKQLGNYPESLKALTQWTIRSDDPVAIESNILRMGELMTYPEIYSNGIQACDELAAGNPLIRTNAFLHSRVEYLKMSLLLRKGKRSEAQALRKKLGFIQDYRLIGPFRNRDDHDFEIRHSLEYQDASMPAHTGKLHRVHWYDAAADFTGVMDAGKRSSGAADSLFYTYAEFHIGDPGTYVLHLGKTGYADVLLDGVTIFRNRKRHGYSADQYRLVVSMTAGRHRLLIKAGDSKSGGIRLSMRITDVFGRGIDLSRKNSPGPDLGKATLISATFFPALDSLMNNPAPEAGDSFLTGYLFHIAGLDSDSGHEASVFFNRAAGSPGITSITSYYLGLTESDQGKRELYFQEASRSDPPALEPVVELGRIQIDNNFIYEAIPLAARLIALNPSSPAGKILQAECCMSRGWYVEALKLAGQLKAMRFSSAGYAIEGRVLAVQQKYKQGARVFETLHSMDRLDESYMRAWIDCLEESGQYERAISILEGLASDFPDDPDIRRRLASLVKYARGAEKAIPYLSAALKQSPFDSKILFELGCVYRAHGRNDMAQHYLQKAQQADPDNFEIRTYLEILNASDNELVPYRIPVHPGFYTEGAEMYRDEAAIVLLDEYAVRILADGSHEKSVRKIIRINDASVIDEFSEQFVVFNPSTDMVESLHCTVYNDGAAVESRGIYSRSLSDPESRLYYDLEAKVVPVSSLRAGSVIDFRYRITSSDGDYYKGFIGERITAGGEHRTVLTSILASYPADRKLYFHLKGISGKDLKTGTAGNRKIIAVTVKNSPPNRKEAAMPELTGSLPCVILTAHNDWESVRRWYMSLAGDRMVISGEMRKALAGLIQGNDDDLEKIRKIYNHVHGAIRYVGFELGLGSIQPRRADLTYKTGMGDCKDMAVVLAAMLREAGLDARLALLRTRDRGELHGSIPFIGQFNHAICYVNIRGGIFLDATSRMSGFRELPSNDSEVSAFVLDAAGYRFITTEGKFYARNEDVSETVVTLKEDGQAKMQRRITKSGDIAPGARLELNDEHAKIKTISEYWNEHFAGTGISNLIIQSAGLETPVVYSYEAEIPSLLTPVDGFLVMKSFLTSSDYYRMYATEMSRHSPLVIAQKTNVRSLIRYKLPPGCRVVRLPEDEQISFGKCDARFTYVVRGNNLIEVRSIIQFKSYRIDKNEYGRFRDLARFVDRKENEAIVIQRVSGN